MSDKMDFQSLSFGMRRIGWIRFWVQSILGVVVAAVLLFSNVVNNSEGQLSLAPGLSLTTISLILLLFSLWQGWLIVRTGRAIASNARPSRGQTGKLIKRGLIVDLFGILFGLIGYQALMGALFIQASSQTTGQLLLHHLIFQLLVLKYYQFLVTHKLLRLIFLDYAFLCGF